MYLNHVSRQIIMLPSMVIIFDSYIYLSVHFDHPNLHQSLNMVVIIIIIILTHKNSYSMFSYLQN
jgi:hypothetical protein